MTPTPPTDTPAPNSARAALVAQAQADGDYAMTPTPAAVAAAREYLTDYCPDGADASDSEVGHLAAIIERNTRVGALQAIVDRLPKTADGMPITPGMYVCFDAGHGCPEMRLHDMHVMQRVEFDFKTPSIELQTERRTDFSTGANRLYSTREAALAALSAAPAAGEVGK